MKNIVLYSVLVVLLSACSGFYSGQLVSLDSEKSVDKNGHAFGYAEAVYVLGFGGLNREAVMFQAKNNLRRYHPLQENEHYVNISLDTRLRNYILFQKVGYLVHAEVERLDEKNTGASIRNTETTNPDSLIFDVGKTVINKDFEAYEIIGVQNKRCFVIPANWNFETMRIKSMPKKNLFLKQSRYKDFSLGKKIELGYTSNNYSDERIINNVVNYKAFFPKGFGLKKMLLQPQKSKKIILMKNKKILRKKRTD